MMSFLRVDNISTNSWLEQMRFGWGHDGFDAKGFWLELSRSGISMAAKQLDAVSKAPGSGKAVSHPTGHQAGAKICRRPTKKKASTKQSWNSVRASEVARARILMQNKDYPSPRIMEAVAELLARNLKPSVQRRPRR